MLRYSKSFIFSLLIHLVLAVGLFSLYKTLSASAEEQHLCACCSTTINLSTIQTQTLKTPVKEEKIEKPLEKKVEKKKIVKQVEKKEPVVTQEVLAQKEVVKQKQEPLETVIEEVKEVVEVDQNITKSVENLQEKKDVDTNCKTEVIVTNEPKQTEENYLSLHVSEIVSLLKDNLYYPRRARMQGIEGVVTIRFTLSTEAKISNIEVVKSEHDILSRAAVETIENLEEKLPKPDEELTLTIPINYDLH